jgi:hypothetical protein
MISCPERRLSAAEFHRNEEKDRNPDQGLLNAIQGFFVMKSGRFSLAVVKTGVSRLWRKTLPLTLTRAK